MEEHTNPNIDTLSSAPDENATFFVYHVPGYLKEKTHPNDNTRRIPLHAGHTVRDVLFRSRLHKPRDMFLATKVTEETVIPTGHEQYLITFPEYQPVQR